MDATEQRSPDVDGPAGGTSRPPADRLLTDLLELPPAVRLRTVPYALVAAAAIGVPSDLIDTPFFGRPVPVRSIDYLIWAITSLLIGLVLAIRPDPDADAAPGGDEAAAERAAEGEGEGNRAIWGGFVSFLSVGCPVCNQAVVALVGTSGALTWWAPVQPLLGLAAVVLLVVALRKRLRTYRLSSCPLPA